MIAVAFAPRWRLALKQFRKVQPLPFGVLPAMLRDLGGVYCEDADIAQLNSPNSSLSHGVSPCSLDEVSAKNLWKLSESLTGVEFKIV